MTNGGRRATASVLGALAGGALVLTGAAPASAESYLPTLDGSNWYWAGQTQPPAAGAPALPAPLPGQASGVPDGDLGVAYVNGGPDKVTALQVGVASVPIGARFDAFTLKMKLDASSTSATAGTPAGTAALSACELLDRFNDGTGPAPYASAPVASSAACADGVFDAATSTYTFNLAAIATDWAGGTPVSGVLIQPKVGSTTPFNYAFDKKSIAMAATYTAGPVVPAAPAPAALPPVAAPPAAVPAPLTGPVTFPAPPLQALPSTVLAPAAPAPAPQTAPVPVAVTVAPAAAGTPFPVNSLRPNGAFWAAGAALALLLLGLSAVLGDPLAPVPLDPRRRRFADIVRSRAAGREAAAAAPPRPAQRLARPARPARPA